MSKYKWFRRLRGGYWVYFKSCATGSEWHKVSQTSYEYFRFKEGLPTESYPC